MLDNFAEGKQRLQFFVTLQELIMLHCKDRFSKPKFGQEKKISSFSGPPASLLADLAFFFLN